MLRYVSDIAVIALVGNFFIRWVAVILGALFRFIPFRVLVPTIAGVLWILFASLLASYTLNVTLRRPGTGAVYWLLGGLALFFSCGGAVNQVQTVLSRQRDQALMAWRLDDARECLEIGHRIQFVLPGTVLVYLLFALFPSLLGNPFSRLVGRAMDSVFALLNSWLPSSLWLLIRIGSFSYVVYWAYLSIAMIIMLMMSILSTLAGRNDANRISSRNSRSAQDRGGPCPHCGRPLRTPTARQCRHCGADWH